jgi:hypothetical protein
MRVTKLTRSDAAPVARVFQCAPGGRWQVALVPISNNITESVEFV